MIFKKLKLKWQVIIYYDKHLYRSVRQNDGQRDLDFRTYLKRMLRPSNSLFFLDISIWTKVVNQPTRPSLELCC